MDQRLSLRRRRLLASAGGLALASPGVARAQPGRGFVVAFPTDPRSLDPMFRDDAVSGSIQRHLFDTLAHRFPDMAIRPWLAESIDQVSSTSWRARLKDGIRFTNGEALDAQAVKYSLDRILNPDNKSPIRSLISPLGQAQVEDPRTVLFTLPKPDPLFTARLTWLMIVPPKHAEAAGTGFANQPIGSGPYVLKRWTRNSEVVLEANPDFWGAKPAYAHATFKTVPEEIARVSALRSGEIDLAFNLSANQAASLDAAPGFKALPQATSRVAVLNFNPAAEPAGKLAFRQAVAQAVNADELLRGLVKTLGSPSRGLLAPAIQNVPADPPGGYPRNPDAAKKAVEQLGLKGAEIEVGGPAGRFPLDREIASAVAAQLRRAGLAAKPRATEFGTYMTDIKAGRAAPVFLQVQGNAWFDPVPQLNAFYVTGGLGSPWKDPETDRLLDATSQSPGPGRIAAIGSLLGHLHAQVMSVPLFAYTYLHGVKDGFKGPMRADEFVFVFELA